MIPGNRYSRVSVRIVVGVPLSEERDPIACRPYIHQDGEVPPLYCEMMVHPPEYERGGCEGSGGEGGGGGGGGGGGEGGGGGGEGGGGGGGGGGECGGGGEGGVKWGCYP